MGSRRLQPRLPAEKGRRVAIVPTTRAGRWTVGLAVWFLVGVPAWTIVPGGAMLGFACGLAGGIVALVAIVRHRERALTVFAALVPLVLVVLFVLAELIVGHGRPLGQAT